MIGLGLGLFEFLTGITLVGGLAPVKDSFELLFNLAFTLPVLVAKLSSGVAAIIVAAIVSKKTA